MVTANHKLPSLYPKDRLKLTGRVNARANGAFTRPSLINSDTNHQCTGEDYSFFLTSKNADSKSIGRGKIVVLLFSLAISVKV
jgi:hypothetical protein